VRAHYARGTAAAPPSAVDGPAQHPHRLASKRSEPSSKDGRVPRARFGLEMVLEMRETVDLTSKERELRGRSRG
jgi:hypothetical protein